MASIQASLRNSSSFLIRTSNSSETSEASRVSSRLSVSIASLSKIAGSPPNSASSSESLGGLARTAGQVRVTRLADLRGLPGSLSTAHLSLSSARSFSDTASIASGSHSTVSTINRNGFNPYGKCFKR